MKKTKRKNVAKKIATMKDSDLLRLKKDMDKKKAGTKEPQTNLQSAVSEKSEDRKDEEDAEPK